MYVGSGYFGLGPRLFFFPSCGPAEGKLSTVSNVKASAFIGGGLRDLVSRMGGSGIVVFGRMLRGVGNGLLVVLDCELGGSLCSLCFRVITLVI